jgi:GH43 family beta-xylosidase
MKTNLYVSFSSSFTRLVIFAFVLFSGASLNAQVIGWDHPNSPPPYGLFSVGGAAAGVEVGRSICVDASGNIYVYGTFAGTDDFDPSGSTNTMTANGTSSDVFVVKYNSSGVFQWAARGGVANSGDNSSGGHGQICTDGTNVYVAGSFSAAGSATFTPAAGGCTTCSPSPANSQGFVGKLDCAGGQWQWIQPWGTAAQNQGHSVCVDASGNVYVSGEANGNFTLGPSSISTVDAQAFFGKLNAAGVWQWAVTGGGTGSDASAGGSISYNANLGRLTATGSYNSLTVSFGSFGIPNTTGSTDMFLVELNPATGAFLSAFGFGSAAGADEISGNCYDPNTHDIFICGQMSGAVSTLPGIGTLNQANASNDIFVARYTPNATPTSGTFTWAKSYGLSGIDRAYDISANAIGQINFCGYFTGPGTIDFGAGSSTQVTSSNTTQEIFVAEVQASSGAGVFAIQATDNGTGGVDQARGICTRQNGIGTIWATGEFTAGGAVTFTPTAQSNSLSLSSAGTTDIWVGKVFAVPPLVATQSQVNLTCNGVCTGSATVVASGGVAPYTYSWSPSGGSGATASNLCAINYTCTITDALSTSITKTFSITQPTAITSSIVSQTNVACNGGSNGAATITASGGTGTLTYNWTPGNPTGDGTVSVSGLNATQTWTCTITDANTCTHTQTVNITQPTAIVVTPISQTNVACFGGSNGAAQVSASGGTGTLTYNWTPGNPPGDGTGSVTGLTAQVYTVTVTDANSCTATRTFNITQPASPVSGTTVVTNVSCFGGSNGAINLTPTGGTPGYTYNWLPSGPTTQNRTGLAAGTYSVQITDANGCTGTVTATVTQPTSPVSGTTVVTNVACFGGNTGAINLTPTGGTGPYTENWLPSGPTTEDRTNLVAGTYSVQITDVNGCTGTVTATVTQPTSPVSGTTVVTNVACFGGNTGAINLTPTGGTGPYTENWLPSGPTTEDRTNLVAGTYSVQITDVNGCTGTVTATVTQPTSPVSGTTVVTNVACFGGNTGAINLTPTGGTGPYTENWLPSGPTTEDRTNLVAGTYSVQITDVNGCTGTVTATVTQPTSPVSGTTVVTNVSCFGGSNGAITLTPTGGTPGYTYNWLPSGPTTQNRTGLAAGTYSVQITDANGCTGTVTATVTQPTSPVSGTTVVTNVSCFGGSNGAITLTPTGGAPGYTYNWLPSGPTTQNRTGLAAGTYSVQITDANGCTGTVTTTVTQPTSPVSGTTVVTNVPCFGGSNGAITLTPTGGTPGYTYNWLPSGPTTQNRTGLSAGTYSVQITDANGCTGTVTATVTQPPVLTVSITVTNVNCNSASTGSLTAVPSGGSPAYSYFWNPGNFTTQTINNLSVGCYTVIVTDSHGCTAATASCITQPTAISVTAVSQTNISCNGGSNGAASVSASGGTGTLTYDWTPGNPTGDGTNSVSGLTAGNWTCTVTDANGCIGTQTFNITQPPVITVAASSQTNISCNGGSNGTATVAASGGTGTLAYNWTPGNPAGDGTNSVSGLTAGSWTCTVTDANSCTSSQSFTITEPAVLSASTMQTNVSCNGGNNGDAMVMVSGGTPGYSYSWTPTGGNGAMATGLMAGSYTCIITDANSCTTSQTFSITEPPALTSMDMQTNISCNGGNNGDAMVMVMGGTGAYTYSWSPVAGNTDMITNLTAGNYSCMITDGNGCSITETFTITEPFALSSTDTQTDVSCNGGNNGDAMVMISGGTIPYSYSWSPSGGNGSMAMGLTAGNYSCLVTDNNGCTLTETFSIIEPAALSFTTTQTNVSCNGGTNGDATVSVSGGTGAYTYAWLPSGGTNATETNLAAGNYSCTIMDANSCQVTATFTITEPTALSAMVDAAVNPSSCGASDGSISITVSGGTPAYNYSWSNSTTAEDVTGIPAGGYTCTITDGNGCTTSISASVNDPNAPAVTVSIDTTLCSTAGLYTLIDGSPAGGTWSGSFVGGNTFNPSAAGVGSYLLTYSYTDINGCTGLASDTMLVDACLGFSSNENQGWTVFPNPTNGLLTITPAIINGEKMLVEIYGVDGQLVLSQNRTQEILDLDLQKQPVGIYFIRITTTQRSEVYRIVKM